MDVAALRNGYRTLLDAAAATAAGAGPGRRDEWSADQILAHVVLVNAATIEAVSAVVSGAVATYDNRIASDTWTIERVIGLTAGRTGLLERIRRQGDALCALVPALSEAEVATLIPTLLISHGEVLVDQPLALRDIVSGLAAVELPGHAQQLLNLPEVEVTP
jgi:hypothetical protein